MSPPTVITAPESLIRRAIWDAIRNYPTTAEVFDGEYDWEDSLIPITDDGHPESPSCPAISIKPASENFDWIMNQMQHASMFFEITIYTKTFNLLEPEDLFTKVRDAIWKSKPAEGRPTYIEAATLYPPTRFTNGKMVQKNLGKQKSFPAVVTTVTLELRRLNNPLPH